MYLGEKTKNGLKKGDKTGRKEIKRPYKRTMLVRTVFNGARRVGNLLPTRFSPIGIKRA